jgi:glycosyltransferase involved in cell wall biosynthesis
VNVFGRGVSVDQQIVFPFKLFPRSDYHNIYTDAIKSLMLKFKCEIVIDTYSDSMLPGVDVCYIHYPRLKRMENLLRRIRNKIYFCPYRSLLHFRREAINRRLIFANSKFTAEAVKAEFGVNPHVLYPPVGRDFLVHRKTDFNAQRSNIVTTIARISESENIKIVPHIAELTSKEISFIIAGILGSETALGLLLSLIKKLNLSERIKILTNVKRDDLIGMLLKSKVYLHPVVNEHFGISIVEAMSCGSIPVVHDSGGPREFVPDDLRYKSLEEAAEKVEKAVDDWSQEKARKISNLALRFNEENFSKQFIEIFNSYIHEKY